MNKFIKYLFYVIGSCLLLMTTSCEKESLSHQINKWLSSDLEGDEITMFITDSPKSIQFRSASKSLYIETDDNFISFYSWTTKTIVGNICTQDGLITPSHVGSTYLHIHDSLHNDTIIRVKIIGEFYTYTEPAIDFDDTEDSVNTKLHELFGHFTYYSDSHYYQIGDSRCRYNLYVNYSDDGVVDNYIVELYQGVESDELTGYINERYYKTTASVGGLPVYIKAHNNEYPSISDATVVVIPDLTAHKVKYQNPLTYGN